MPIPILPALAALLIAPDAGRPVAATVETSLVTRGEQIRQLAFDGDPATYFASATGLKASDHFSLAFDEPIPVDSIEILAGLDGEASPDGTLEISRDGETFARMTTFRHGTTHVGLFGRKVKVIRLGATADQPEPLVVREIRVKSAAPTATFAHPVEFVVDVSDAPELKAWADDVARLCERWYGRINEELKSDGYKPARVVTMALRKDYDGVAAAGGGRIVGSTAYFKAHPDDKGAFIHEAVHIVQRYPGPSNPGWLVEGVADYVRFFRYEPPGQLGPIDAERAHYDDSYRTSAAFLDYVARTYDEKLVLKLNALLRAGKYKDDAFKELTGKTLPELDEEWRRTLKG